MKYTINPGRAARAMALAAVALLCPLAAFGQIVVAVPPGDLTDAINNATANTRLRLQGNANYTITGAVTIDENRNSPLSIEGPGGAADLPSDLLIQVSGTIDVAQNATLTLKEVGLVGGNPALTIATGATLNLGDCFLTQGNPSIVLPSTSLTQAKPTLNAASCVFYSSNRAILQNGGVTNIVQCTFLECAPASMQISGGKSNVVASLFALPGDAPIVFGSSFEGHWHGNLIEQNSAAPVNFNDSTTNAPVRTDPIVFSTDVDAWPGKLDQTATPVLVSGVNSAASTPAISEAINAVASLRKTDFEGDRRGTALQVGADELGAGQLAGWISGAITVLDDNNNLVTKADGTTVAGPEDSVTVQVETRGVNLANALLRVRRQLGDPDQTGDYIDYEISELADGFGTVTFNAPGATCYTVNGVESIWDGRAEIYIQSGATRLSGADNSLAAFEYQFVIDTTAPILGFDSGGVAYTALRLTDVLGSNDLTLGATTNRYGFPTVWGPSITGGFNPGNEATFGSTEDKNPQVYFNVPLVGNFSFTLPLQFYDAPPSLCDDPDIAAPVETGGFEPAPPTILDELLADDDSIRGTAFLGTELPSALSGYIFQLLQTSGTLLNANDTLDAEWTFNNVAISTTRSAILNPTASDLADNRYNDGFHRDLEFWWLDQSELNASAVSLSGPGDPEKPSFSWSINRSPSPRQEDVDTCKQLVSYRLWRARNPSDPNTAFDAVSEWSAYTDIDTITTTSFLPALNSVTPESDRLGDILADGLNVNGTMMLTLLVADEAGNLMESLASADVPISLAALQPGNAVIGDFDAFATERLQVESATPGVLIDGPPLIPFVYWNNTEDLGRTVDTDLRAKLFWNRVNANGGPIGNADSIRQPVAQVAGERDWGASTTIPLPPIDDEAAGVFTRVESQFYLTATGSNASDPCRIIRWELLEDSRVIAVGGMRVFQETGYQGVLQIPEDILRGVVAPNQSPYEYDFPFEVLVVFIDDDDRRLPQDPPIFNSSPKAPDFVQPDDRLGDEGAEGDFRRRNVNYMLRAATLALPYDDPMGSYRSDNIDLYIDLLNLIPSDNSPATFKFTVTPNGNLDAVGESEQPIKIQSQR